MAGVDLGGYRTVLTAPMLKEDVLIGVISIYRQEVRPFTDKQIELVKNFAAQAVIAIENTRLLNELRESLQQQTATADVLKVISAPPGKLEPVFQAILANATEICQTKFGTLNLFENNTFRSVALHNPPPQFRMRLGQILHPHPESGLAHVARTKQIAHIEDIRTQKPYLEGNQAIVELADLAGARTQLSVPLLKEGAPPRFYVHYRQEVRRSPISRSSWSRTSPLRPSSLSRTRAYSTNCANRYSSRPRPPRCSKSSAAQPSTFNPCSTR